VSGQQGMLDPRAGADLLWMEPSDRQLVPGPLYHNAPFLQSHLGLFLGQHVHLMPRFDAHGALDIIERARVTWLNLVPTMMLRMLRAMDERARPVDLSSLRLVWHMAAPCPAWVKDRWIELVGPERLMELYGGTESQALTRISGAEWLEHRGSVGRPFRGEMIVLDEDGQRAAPGEIGEIYMRAGDGVPRPYHYIGADVRERDGWDSLGDMGWMDDDGYLYIADRRSDMIVSGGANVYPAEVEAAISEHPAVLSCAVVGAPDDDLGNRVHAVVQTTRPVEIGDLVRHLEERLVRYKIPRTWELTDRSLRDDAGKVRRSAIRDDVIRRQAIGATEQPA
jgi:bile acid-coenzyme A ligase